MKSLWVLDDRADDSRSGSLAKERERPAATRTRTWVATRGRPLPRALRCEAPRKGVAADENGGGWTSGVEKSACPPLRGPARPRPGHAAPGVAPPRFPRDWFRGRPGIA
jgi:hypothetical protein